MFGLEDCKYSDYTRYPNIYKDVYWGTHRFMIDENMGYREKVNKVFDNRNKFVEEYNVSENYDESPEEVRQKVLDEISWRRHIEYYKCSNGKTLVIFSRHINDEQHERYLSNGYKHIYPMYALDQNTYMKYF